MQHCKEATHAADWGPASSRQAALTEAACLAEEVMRLPIPTTQLCRYGRLMCPAIYAHWLVLLTSQAYFFTQCPCSAWGCWYPGAIFMLIGGSPGRGHLVTPGFGVTPGYAWLRAASACWCSRCHCYAPWAPTAAAAPLHASARPWNVDRAGGICRRRMSQRAQSPRLPPTAPLLSPL